jgi:hypothetical protein
MVFNNDGLGDVSGRLEKWRNQAVSDYDGRGVCALRLEAWLNKGPEVHRELRSRLADIWKELKRLQCQMMDLVWMNFTSGAKETGCACIVSGAERSDPYRGVQVIARAHDKVHELLGMKSMDVPQAASKVDASGGYAECKGEPWMEAVKMYP